MATTNHVQVILDFGPRPGCQTLAEDSGLLLSCLNLKAGCKGWFETKRNAFEHLSGIKLVLLTCCMLGQVFHKDVAEEDHELICEAMFQDVQSLIDGEEHELEIQLVQG